MNRRLIVTLKHIVANTAEDLYRRGSKKIDWQFVSFDKKTTHSGGKRMTLVYEGQHDGNIYVLTLKYEPGMASRVSGDFPHEFKIELELKDGTSYSFDKKFNYSFDAFPSFK